MGVVNSSNYKEKVDLFSRLLRKWHFLGFANTVNHNDVLEKVRDEGRMTSRYCFMVLMSCGIAILGLLLSSPAVIIGAMLISPLMGPIISFGFSLAVLDFRQMKRALEGIILGLVMAVVVSSTIVYFSPITDVTSEILAAYKTEFF